MANLVATEQPSPLHVVLERDCILVVGPEMMRIPADSQFLTAASEPFRAMLRPEWREGNEMSSRIEPVETTLPEDDATALQLLCSVIHHQNDTVPDELPTYTVLSVAVAADKYDCTRALRFASENWLCLDRRDLIEDMVVLTATAYRFGNAAAFRKITKRMILDHDGPFTAIPGAEVLNETDWRVLGECGRSHLRFFLAHIADWRMIRSTRRGKRHGKTRIRRNTAEWDPRSCQDMRSPMRMVKQVYLRLLETSEDARPLAEDHEWHISRKCDIEG